jgi:ribokinase
MLTGAQDILSLDDAEAVAGQLANTYRAAVVTAGGLGLAYAGRGLGQGVIPAVPVTVVGTHGAGDMFVGSVAAALAAGADIVPALSLANEAAAAHVSSVRAL